MPCQYLAKDNSCMIGCCIGWMEQLDVEWDCDTDITQYSGIRDIQYCKDITLFGDEDDKEVK
jgi:hypothetical protein